MAEYFLKKTFDEFKLFNSNNDFLFLVYNLVLYYFQNPRPSVDESAQ